jgi:hypothetical protein
LEISPEQHAFRRRDPTSTLAFGPNRGRSRLRGELLVIPEFLFLETVLGNEKSTDDAGELRSRPWRRRTGAGNQPVTVKDSLGAILKPSDPDPTVYKRRYPFVARFL